MKYFKSESIYCKVRSTIGKIVRLCRLNSEEVKNQSNLCKQHILIVLYISGRNATDGLFYSHS